jgi:hypothetical protein
MEFFIRLLLLALKGMEKGFNTLDGRSKNNGMAAFFSQDGKTKNVTSNTEEQDVSGWSWYIG